MRHILLSSLLLAFPLHAFAINKCESNGTTTYSEMPCLDADGKSQTLKEPPPPDNPKAARQELARQKAEGNRLEKVRLKREEKEERLQQQAARQAAVKRKKCAVSNLHKKWAEEDASKAEGKSKAKAKQKAQRVGEKHLLECGSTG